MIVYSCHAVALRLFRFLRTSNVSRLLVALLLYLKGLAISEVDRVGELFARGYMHLKQVANLNEASLRSGLRDVCLQVNTLRN